MKEDQTRELTVREAGRLGGEKRKREGADYAALGRLGGAARKAQNPDYTALGQAGSLVNAERRGPEWYKQIGALGGQAKARKYRKLDTKAEAKKEASDVA